jgi:Lon-like protease
MNQRLAAAVLALPLVAALVVVALVEPLPYVTYQPGPTIDVLAENNGKEIIQVSGHKTYRDDGELRMTTVSVSQRNTDINLFRVMGDWLNPDNGVYPRGAVYQEGQTQEEDRNAGAVEMITSQDAAAAVALRELGYRPESVLEVLQISAGKPADGALAVRDILRGVNGKDLDPDLATAQQQVLDAIAAAAPGEAVRFTVLRDGEEIDVPVVPEKNEEGRPVVGMTIGEGFILPFSVRVGIDSRIGGPSAGLMFSLAIYDTLTPGSLTGGQAVAGTGGIDADGKVESIGGIQQKIVGARDAGAELFLVPAANCGDVDGARNGDMRLVKAETMSSALESIETWVEDPEATLPSCGGDA